MSNEERKDLTVKLNIQTMYIIGSMIVMFGSGIYYFAQKTSMLESLSKDTIENKQSIGRLQASEMMQDVNIATMQAQIKSISQ